ncbi:MAG TPA: aldo/keto reductase [Burkholderiales bacterium]|nr:aldo/keto reductase [Burkholderiales bacterium]
MDPRRRALLALLAAGALKPSFAQDGIMTKRIPSTGEALPIVGVGTWQTFDVGNDPSARAPLREVLKLLNRNLIDSSPMYGSSEAVAGDLIAELGMRDKLFVATKVWTNGRDAGIAQMETSFRRLRVERMDLMQVHNLADVTTHTKTLLDWKDKKRIRYVGITHHTSSAYAEVERAMKTRQYDFLQINYSLGEKESERRLLPLAQELKIAVIANRPFAEGALFRRVKGKPLPPWAAELGIESWAQYFLKWIVAHPAVTCTIPGTGNPKHMKDNLGGGHGPLPDESERRRMAEYFDAQG